MKREYKEAAVEVVEFMNSNIIVTSYCPIKDENECGREERD